MDDLAGPIQVSDFPAFDEYDGQRRPRKARAARWLAGSLTAFAAVLALSVGLGRTTALGGSDRAARP